MLGNFGAKLNLYFIVSCPKYVLAPLKIRIIIFDQSQFF